MEAEAYAHEMCERIEALFADARDAEGDEIGPTPLAFGLPYVVIANGRVKPEGYPAWEALSKKVVMDETLQTVSHLFPDAKNDTLIWRWRPECETIKGKLHISLRLGSIGSAQHELAAKRKRWAA